MKVLLIEDDIDCSNSLKRYLDSMGILCDVSPYGEEGFEMMKNADYDVIIADINLPDISGNQLIKKIRFSGAAKKQVPIIVTSGLSSVDSKIESFICGADDYLIKPFDRRELIARINNAVRRSIGQINNEIVINEDTILDLNSKCVKVKSQDIYLTGKEYDLFEFLTLRKGSVLSKRTILDYLYGGENTPTQKIVDVLICKIRNKIFTRSDIDCISTSWGQGYKINQ